VGEVERTLGMKVSWTLKNDYRAVIDSINEGRPAVLRKKSAYSQNVETVAADLTGVGAQPKKSRSGFLGKLMAGASK
jgi:septum formation inhibitor-activating ATPase MinD